MPAVRPDTLAVAVSAATSVQVAPLWSPWYHHFAVWWAMRSRAPVDEMFSAVSVGAAMMVKFHVVSLVMPA